MPASGVKGKTWGPSTCHQRERGQIPLIRSTPRPGGVWSKSAPNLDKPRTVLSRPQHDIGNTSPISDNKNSGDKGDHVHTSTLQLFKNKVTAFNLSEFKPFRSSLRNNSFPTNNASLLPSPVLVTRHNRLSRSIGNISESHYDTVFSTNSFVIAQGVSNNNSVEFSKDYTDLHNDKEKLLKD